MGTWGLGDMGFRGHSTEDIHTFRLRHGDMGFRGHGTEDIQTFRVRHGDMGAQVGKGTWGLALDMGTWGHRWGRGHGV